MYNELGEIIYNFTNKEVLNLSNTPHVSTYEENKELLDEYEGRIKK